MDHFHPNNKILLKKCLLLWQYNSLAVVSKQFYTFTTTDLLKELYAPINNPGQLHYSIIWLPKAGKHKCVGSGDEFEKIM